MWGGDNIGPECWKGEDTFLCNATYEGINDKAYDGAVAWTAEESSIIDGIFHYPLVSRLHHMCKDGTQCVPRSKVCQGTEPLCQDRSDQALCSSTSSQTCLTPDNLLKDFVPCPSKSPGLATTYNQCYHPGQGAGYTHCITRYDVAKTAFRTEDNSVNADQLQLCKSPNGNLGIMCFNREIDGGCLEAWKWCNPKFKIPCKIDNSTSSLEILTTEENICGNSTFWKDKNCDPVWGLDYEKNNGTRCSGRNPGQCMYPINIWLENDELQNDPAVLRQCGDLSDQIHTANAPCEDKCRNNHISCYSNETDLRNAELCAECQDPDRCQDSCEDPGPGCIACTNTKDYFTCPVDGQLKCLKKELMCDGVPHCDALGEENCQDIYDRWSSRLIDIFGSRSFDLKSAAEEYQYNTHKNCSELSEPLDENFENCKDIYMKRGEDLKQLKKSLKQKTLKCLSPHFSQVLQ